MLDAVNISGGSPSRFRGLGLTVERIPAEVARRLPGTDPALIRMACRDAIEGRKPRW
jgi:hypothetical protein